MDVLGAGSYFRRSTPRDVRRDTRGGSEWTNRDLRVNKVDRSYRRSPARGRVPL